MNLDCFLKSCRVSGFSPFLMECLVPLLEDLVQDIKLMNDIMDKQDVRGRFASVLELNIKKGKINISSELRVIGFASDSYFVESNRLRLLSRFVASYNLLEECFFVVVCKKKILPVVYNFTYKCFTVKLQ